MNVLRQIRVQKNLILINGSLPLVLLSFDWWSGRLGANPPEAFIRSTGVMALFFLVLTLAVTPLVRHLKLRWLLPHRRWLGLASFYYAIVHLLGYGWFDKGFVFDDISADIIKRPFILLGFTAFLMMTPLAITSTSAMMRKLGIKRWKALHRAVYPLAVIAGMHYWKIVKSDVFYPGIFLAMIAALLLLRRGEERRVHANSDQK